MLQLNSSNIKTFLESKSEELTIIIRKNISKSPEYITKEILNKLDCTTLPLSLLVTKKGKN